MSWAETHLATTLAGDAVVFVICPLLVILIVGLVRWGGKISNTLETQDRALAGLLQDVRPAGEPTLRSLVQGLAIDVAVVKAKQPGTPST